jgi:hypothetical protein
MVRKRVEKVVRGVVVTSVGWDREVGGEKSGEVVRWCREEYERARVIHTATDTKRERDIHSHTNTHTYTIPHYKHTHTHTHLLHARP